MEKTEDEKKVEELKKAMENYDPNAGHIKVREIESAPGIKVNVVADLDPYKGNKQTIKGPGGVDNMVHFDKKGYQSDVEGE